MAINTGTIIVKADGRSLRAKAESITFKPGGFAREAIMADGRVVGYFEKPIPSELTADTVHDADTDVDELRALTGATVVLEMDSGQVWQIDDAFSDNEGTEIGDAGKGMKIKINGKAAERVA
jgi:hypothetical protein